MSNQKLGILAVVAAVMVLLAVVTSRNPKGQERRLSEPTHLIQGLDTTSIDHITVGKGKDLVTIQRDGAQFVVKDINYPADPKQINDLINKSLDIKTIDLCTSDPKNHADLEVTEDKAHSIVKFFKADGSLLTGVVVGKKLKESDAKTVLTALQGLRFDDVNTPEQVPGLTFDHKYVARMNDSTEYTLELAKKGGKTYLKAQAVYTNPEKVTINPGQKDSQEELKKKEAILLAQEGAQRFTLRHKAWIYEIPDWKAKNLTKPQSELLEAKEKPAKATTATGPAVGPDLSKVLPPAAPNEPTVAPQPAEPNK